MPWEQMFLPLKGSLKIFFGHYSMIQISVPRVSRFYVDTLNCINCFPTTYLHHGNTHVDTPQPIYIKILRHTSFWNGYRYFFSYYILLVFFSWKQLIANSLIAHKCLEYLLQRFVIFFFHFFCRLHIRLTYRSLKYVPA